MKNNNAQHSGTSSSIHDTQSGRVSVVLNPNTGDITKPSIYDDIREILSKQDNVNPTVMETLNSAAKGLLWAMKDIFYYINNEKGGVEKTPKLQDLGIKALTEAKDGGNTQAIDNYNLLVKNGEIKERTSDQEQPSILSLIPTHRVIKINPLLVMENTLDTTGNSVRGSGKVHIQELTLADNFKSLANSGRAIEAANEAKPPIYDRIKEILIEQDVNKEVLTALNGAAKGQPWAMYDTFYYINNPHKGEIDFDKLDDKASRELKELGFEALTEAKDNNNELAIENHADLVEKGIIKEAPDECMQVPVMGHENIVGIACGLKEHLQDKGYEDPAELDIRFTSKLGGGYFIWPNEQQPTTTEGESLSLALLPKL